MQVAVLPVEFRKEIIQQVFSTLTAGESCSLVGVGSCGKSNVVRHLTRPDVYKHYLGESANRVLGVYTDCTRLADYTMRSLHILILEAMVAATQQAGPERAALHETLEKLWGRAIVSDSPDLVRRSLDQAVSHTLQSEIDQVLIILDDFDHVVRETPGPALNSLRALRDNYKYKLVYVTVTRRELGFLRDEDEYQDFHEIVCSATIPMGPYSEADASFMIDRLLRRWGLSVELSATERQRLLQVSGCHAGLLQAVLRATLYTERIPLSSPDLLEKLRGHKDVEPECSKIWQSLEKGEQDDLQALIQQGWPVGDGIHSLERKSLIRQRLDGTLDIFSPVFADYIRDLARSGRVVIELMPEQRQVRADGRLIQDLDQVEYQLLTCLHAQRGRPVPRRDLIKEMVGAQVNRRRFQGSPEQRLDAYMAEMRRKINTADREYIMTDGAGNYWMIGPDGR